MKVNSMNTQAWNGREMQAHLARLGIRAQKVTRKRFSGHFVAEFFVPNLEASVPPARDWAARIQQQLGGASIIAAHDTRAAWRPGQPIIAASVTFAL